MRLEGKTAVITGAARGLGRAYALRFAREGAAVVVVDLREDGAEETARLVSEAGGRALAVHGDATDEAQMAAMAERVAGEFGHIDVLVNNAALYGDMDFADQSVAYFRKVLDINVSSIVVVSRAAFPHMKERGGSIINISSSAAYPLPLPSPRELTTIPVSAYAVSKAAVINLTKSMAKAVGGYKIRVNAIAPGVTMTEATKGLVPGVIIDNLTEATALRRTLEPEDITGAAVFLASDDSALMTGQVVVVDGGLVMLG